MPNNTVNYYIQGFPVFLTEWRVPHWINWRSLVRKGSDAGDIWVVSKHTWMMKYDS